MAESSLGRRCIAEGFGTFTLVFAGCGAIVVDSERGGALGANGIALAFGLAVMVMVYAIGHVSGAHINPAVTAAFVATRHFRGREALAYVPAATRRRSRCGASASPRLGRNAGRSRSDRPECRCRPRVRVRGRAHGVPDVRDHGRRDRHAGGGRRRCDRDRRDGRARRARRRRRDRSVDEPGSLVRAGARRLRVDRLLDLRPRACGRSAGRRVPLHARARRAGTRRRPARARAGGASGSPSAWPRRPPLR